MEIIRDMVIAFFAAFGIICSVWCVFGQPIMPRPFQNSGRVKAVILAGEDSEQMGQSILALRWLKKRGMKDLEIMIADDGMSAETRQRAEYYARENADVDFCGGWEPSG